MGHPWMSDAAGPLGAVWSGYASAIATGPATAFQSNAQGNRMNSSEDRRHFWRVPFHSTAGLVGADGVAHAGRLHDLSLKGALFEVADAWQGTPGEQCRLQVELSEDTPIHMQATVMHVEGRNIGLRCDEIDIDSITALRRVIELNAADSALLERELGALVQGG